MSICLLLPAAAVSCSKSEQLNSLVILHTNDTHASLDDIGRRATLVAQIREESGRDNVLLLDAGDVFTGSLYFNTSHGLADLWFMEYMGYDAMTVGNHEFDKGSQMLADFIDEADFPVMCANFDFSNESTLNGKLPAWTIVEKDGQKYGIIGATSEDTNELSSPSRNIIINDASTAVSKAVQELEQEGINKIIVLSHLGWTADLELAAEVADIDIIVGGHSHTVPEEYPTVIEQSGHPVLGVQAGSHGEYLGELNVQFDKKGIVRNWDNSRLIPIDDSISVDAVCQEKLNEFSQPIEALMNIQVGSTLVDLDGEAAHVRGQETNLGNLVADAMLDQAGSKGATLAVINGGAIRASIPAGDISFGHIFEVRPFGNYLVVIEISGQQIQEALENGVSQVEKTAGRFPQVAGLRYCWDPQAAPGSRIVSIDVLEDGDYQPLDPAALYKVATVDFLVSGGDGYTAFTAYSNLYNTGLMDYEVLENYIGTHSPVAPAVEGRITQTTN
jgi:2',3'-cyclic-nucleotide 2'-phosphodiesterase (5'-nucleotidase family)